MGTYKRKDHYQNKDVAEIYMKRRFSHPTGERENAEMTEALARVMHSLPGVERVLDIPCGSGRFADFFCEGGYGYCGADVSMEMISVLANDQNKKGRVPLLVRCDGEALPFKDDTFDCVVCIRFLHHHMPDSARVRILAEMRRVSRQWLIVQSQRLWYLGGRAVLKTFMRKLFGRKVRRHRFHKEAIRAGWLEMSWSGKRPTHRHVEVYRKGKAQ